MKLVITLFLCLCCFLSINILHAQKAHIRGPHSFEKTATGVNLKKSSGSDIIDTDFLSREEEDEDAERKYTLRIFTLISRIYAEGKIESSAIPLLYCHLALNAESCKYIKQRVLRI
jgi:hypothetical protein